MSELTTEQFNELPDYLKASYVKDGDGYSHGGFIKVKGTANELDRKAKESADELNSYRSEEQKRLDAAKQEAYEKAKADGHTDEVEKQLLEKLADLERRSDESAKEFKSRMEKLAKKQATAIATELSGIAIKGGEVSFKRLIKDYIQVNPENDEVTYLDDDGCATSLTQVEFLAGLKKNHVFAPLIQADVVTSGGGNANGSQRGSASMKKFNEMNGAELSELRKEDPTRYAALKNEYYSK